METLNINITIEPHFYTKNPASTDLGKKIVRKSIEMIIDLGFEAFTFRKLGVVIGSNESSIYRYFESKHALLVYLINWYWSWIEYKLVFATTNIASAEEKLNNAIVLLTEEIKEDTSVSFINEVLLNRIIIVESSKAYHTKDIDSENEKGFYKAYKRVVQRVSDIVLICLFQRLLKAHTTSVIFRNIYLH
jgi:AcrR family transcriptional regulator